MRSTTLLYLVVTVFTVLFVSARFDPASSLCAQPGEGTDPVLSPYVTIAAAPLKSTFKQREPFPLLVAVGYNGNEPVMLENFGKGEFGVEVADADGKILVPTEPVLEPPPPPPDWHIRDGDQMIFVVPLQVANPGWTSARMLPDALALYRRLPPGRYTVRAAAVLHRYDRKHAIVRQNVSSQWWARPENGEKAIFLKSAPIAITITR